MQGADHKAASELVLRLEQQQQTFTALNVPEKPILSVLRNFSAPIKLEVEGQTEEDLTFLLAHDTDSFTRWEASQTLQRSLIIKLYNAAIEKSEVQSFACKHCESCNLLRALLSLYSSVLKIAMLTMRLRDKLHSQRSAIDRTVSHLKTC